MGSAWAGILTTAPKAQAQFELRTAVKWLPLVATELDVIGLKTFIQANPTVWPKVWLKRGVIGKKKNGSQLYGL